MLEALEFQVWWKDTYVCNLEGKIKQRNEIETPGVWCEYIQFPIIRHSIGYQMQLTIFRQIIGYQRKQDKAKHEGQEVAANARCLFPGRRAS